MVWFQLLKLGVGEFLVLRMFAIYLSILPSNVVYWWWKWMSFVNLCLTESLCRLSVARLARWFILILQYKKDAIFTRRCTWLSSTVVSNMWLCRSGNNVLPALYSSTWMTMAAVIPCPWGSFPEVVLKILWKQRSDSLHTATIPSDGLDKPPRFFNRMKGCTVGEERASAQGMQVCLSFSFLTTKPAM